MKPSIAFAGKAANWSGANSPISLGVNPAMSSGRTPLGNNPPGNGGGLPGPPAGGLSPPPFTTGGLPGPPAGGLSPPGSPPKGSLEAPDEVLKRGPDL